MARVSTLGPRRMDFLKIMTTCVVEAARAYAGSGLELVWSGVQMDRDQSPKSVRDAIYWYGTLRMRAIMLPANWTGMSCWVAARK
jgi:hypothetical protein